VEDFNFEKEDPEFLERVEAFDQQIVDEREELMKKLNRNYERHKLKDLAILPTMTSDYNKYIKKP